MIKHTAPFSFFLSDFIATFFVFCKILPTQQTQQNHSELCHLLSLQFFIPLLTPVHQISHLLTLPYQKKLNDRNHTRFSFLCWFLFWFFALGFVLGFRFRLGGWLLFRLCLLALTSCFLRCLLWCCFSFLCSVLRNALDVYTLQ